MPDLPAIFFSSARPSPASHFNGAHHEYRGSVLEMWQFLQESSSFIGSLPQKSVRKKDEKTALRSRSSLKVKNAEVRILKSATFEIQIYAQLLKDPRFESE